MHTCSLISRNRIEQFVCEWNRGIIRMQNKKHIELMPCIMLVKDNNQTDVSVWANGNVEYLNEHIYFFLLSLFIFNKICCASIYN